MSGGGHGASIRRALAEAGSTGADVRAVGLTGQMHGLTLLDGETGAAAGDPLERSAHRSECDQITEQIGYRLLARTGNPMLPGFTAPKILWVREHEPEVYARTAHILLPKDYVRFRLTGEYAWTRRTGPACCSSI